jgi:hypothetical protein
MRARAWGIGWRVAVALLLPFGWLALILLGPVSSVWSTHLRREYLLWRWRRSRGKTHPVLDARRAAAPPDLPVRRPTTATKPHAAAYRSSSS